jgi:hypothetical protein
VLRQILSLTSHLNFLRSKWAQIEMVHRALASDECFKFPLRFCCSFLIWPTLAMMDF